MGRAMATQLEGEVMHYQAEAVRGSLSTSRPVPLPPLSVSRHRFGNHRPPVGGSQAASKASSGGSIRQPVQPPIAPPLAPPSAPEGEGESAL